MRRRYLLPMGLAFISLLSLAGVANAATGQATAAQVKALVSASSKITKLTPTLVTQLMNDFPANVTDASCPTPSTCGCYTTTQCVAGDASSKRTIVLMGDSHASMWFAAMTSVAKKLGDRLVVLYAITCPVAQLPSNYFYYGNHSDPRCLSWRENSIAAIKKLRPILVVLSERTSQIFTEPGLHPISNATWDSALQDTILKIQNRSTKVAIIEDIPFLDYLSPASCLASHPTNVQACSVPYPNPKNPGHQLAESAAAKKTGASFINSVKWLCTKTCSAVVGRFVVYGNQSHLSLSYSTYLSGVLTTSVKGIL